MSGILPIKENENIGFNYTVTDEQISAHRKRSVKDILTWLEETNKFIYSIQTPEERQRNKDVKNKLID